MKYSRSSENSFIEICRKLYHNPLLFVSEFECLSECTECRRTSVVSTSSIAQAEKCVINCTLIDNFVKHENWQLFLLPMVYLFLFIFVFITFPQMFFYWVREYSPWVLSDSMPLWTKRERATPKLRQGTWSKGRGPMLGGEGDVRGRWNWEMKMVKMEQHFGAMGVILSCDPTWGPIGMQMREERNTDPTPPHVEIFCASPACLPACLPVCLSLIWFCF